jgi:hypothetical protein
MLVQAGLGDLSVSGGFAVQLPKDLICATNTMAWTYRSIVSEPLYVLEGQDALTTWQVQIDAHGYTMADAIRLSRAIDGVLRGSWSGALPDGDATRVNGIFRLPTMVDGFSDANRSYVRSTEYEVHYYQQ